MEKNRRPGPGEESTKRFCPAKLDRFLYENGLNDTTRTQHCCVSGTLRFGRTPKTARIILVDTYKFQNVEDPQLLPVIVPLREQKKRQLITLSPTPTLCIGCKTKHGFQDASSGLYHPFCSQPCRDTRKHDKDKVEDDKETGSIHVFLYGDATLDSMITVCSEKWVEKVYGNATGKTTDYWL